MIFGLEKMDATIIMKIHKEGGMIPHRLAVEGVCVYSHVLNVVNRLIGKGLVERRKINGRTTKIYLTPKGVKVSLQLEMLHEELNS